MIKTAILCAMCDMCLNVIDDHISMKIQLAKIDPWVARKLSKYWKQPSVNTWVNAWFADMYLHRIHSDNAYIGFDLVSNFEKMLDNQK